MQRLQKLIRAVFMAAAVFSVGSVVPQSAGPLSFVSVAEAAVARSIQVQGNTRVEDETVISYMTIVPGRSYSAFDVDESLKALYATGLFATVDITPRGSTVIVTVSENPIINRVSFEGNRKIKDNALETSIRSQPGRRFPVHAYRPTFRTSLNRIGAPGASARPSSRRSSIAGRTASTWFSRSMKVQKPASSASASLATRRSVTVACVM